MFYVEFLRFAVGSFSAFNCDVVCSLCLVNNCDIFSSLRRMTACIKASVHNHAVGHGYVLTGSVCRHVTVLFSVVEIVHKAKIGIWGKS